MNLKNDIKRNINEQYEITHDPNRSLWEKIFDSPKSRIMGMTGYNFYQLLELLGWILIIGLIYGIFWLIKPFI